MSGMLLSEAMHSERSFYMQLKLCYSVVFNTLSIILKVPKVDDVSLVDRVFNGAFGGDGEEEVVMSKGVVVTSSSLEMLTKSCLGGIMVSLIFLEGLEEEG
ncbi:hypothetical protein Tco_0307572 [Tanacetum coccineum]